MVATKPSVKTGPSPAPMRKRRTLSPAGKVRSEKLRKNPPGKIGKRNSRYRRANGTGSIDAATFFTNSVRGGKPFVEGYEAFNRDLLVQGRSLQKKLAQSDSKPSKLADVSSQARLTKPSSNSQSSRKKAVVISKESPKPRTVPVVHRSPIHELQTVKKQPGLISKFISGMGDFVKTIFGYRDDSRLSLGYSAA